MFNVTPEWNKSGLLVESPPIVDSGMRDGDRLLNPGAQAVKRAFDIVAGAALTLASLPFACVIAIAITLETRGPALFSQSRIGRGGRRFTIWKFRTMVVNSEEILHTYLAQHPELEQEWKATHKLKGDPRVTRVGRFLRRRSLDEVPQFWNVLLGDMSLIGPRPIVDEEVPKYGRAFETYKKVKPGLTGLWQVSGRSDTSYRRRVALDTQYIRNWSLGLDLKLIWKTVGVLLRAHGAY